MEFKQSDLPEAVGFPNQGAVCYMNALIQAMLSCADFNDFILSDQATESPVTLAIRKYLLSGDSNLGNIIAPEFAKHSNVSTISSIIAKRRNDIQFKHTLGAVGDFLDNYSNEQDLSEIARKIIGVENFNTVLKPLIELASRLSKGKIQWEGNGWQDSQEAMIHILESTGADKADIFSLHYATKIKCNECNVISETETSDSNKHQDFVYLNEEYCEEKKSKISRKDFLNKLTPEQIDTITISKCVWYNFDRNVENSKKNPFRCPECNYISEKLTKIRILKRLSKVICIFLPHFQGRRSSISLPPHIYCELNNDHCYQFRFVSQVEYTGGHYFAQALRKNGVFCLNDNSVRPGKLEATHQTVLVFYHLEKIIDRLPEYF